MIDTKPKGWKCAYCGGTFYRKVGLEAIVCSPQCGVGRSRRLRADEQKKKDREWKEANKSLTEHLSEAQTAFNAFIRNRDAHLPCVSCGKMKPGQKRDASHYRPTGQNPALRFNELNCHSACVYCNRHMSGNLTPYREELVRRIGLDLVEWLEGPHPPANWTKEEAMLVKEYYSNALKEALIDPLEPQPF